MDIFRYLFNFGDTYYQSGGESIWIKMLPAFLSGLLSFAITYFMFRHQQKIRDKEEEKRLADLKGYIFHCLDALIKLINSQVGILEERIANLQKDTTTGTLRAFHDTMQISVGLNLKQIEKLDVNDTFKILVTDVIDDSQNIKNYQNLMSSGELLIKIADGLNETNKWGSEIYENRLDQILLQLDDINRVMISLSQEQLQPQDPGAYRYHYIVKVQGIWWNYKKKKDDKLESIIYAIAELMDFCLYKPEDEGAAFEEPESKIILTCGQKINEFYNVIIQSKQTQLDNLKLWKEGLRNCTVIYADIIKRIYKNQ